MFNVKQLQQGMAGLVGILQANDPNYPRFDPALTQSSSSKYLQSTHELCTTENIFNSAPEFFAYNYKPWTSTRAYTTSDVVAYGPEPTLYIAIVNVTAGIVPGTDADAWAPYDPYSNWLREKYNAAVNDMARNLLTYKKLNTAGKSLLDSQQLYEGFGQLTDKIVKRGRFVGLQVFVKRVEQIGMRLDRMGIQLFGAQPVPFYVYHSSQVDPIYQFTIEVTRPGSFTWKNVTDVVLGFISDNYDSSGCFYIGYYEDDLNSGVQVIRHNINLMQPCYGCNGADQAAFNRWSKYVTVTAIEVPAVGIQEDRTLFDTSMVTTSSDTNFGLNMGLSVTCDFTAFFLKNKGIMADFLAAQLALTFLNVIAFCTRMNAVSDTSKKMAMAEITLDDNQNTFANMVQKQMIAADYDFQGFNAECLPCNPKRIKVSAI